MPVVGVWAPQLSGQLIDTQSIIAHLRGVERDEQGRLVRRTEAIASIGSAALDNEECSLLVKALRALGLVYVEHQARI